MLRARLIPCLLIKNGGLVKTVKFEDPKYLGDPINAVKIFNEKEVDELVVLDIDATTLGKEPDYAMIRNLAAECRMPLCYGGGVRSVEQAEKIIGMGVEKVAISAAAVADPALVTKMAATLGAQSVVAVMDVKRSGKSREYTLRTHNGKEATSRSPVEFAIQMEQLGAGEIIVNSIDNDGTMEGYDLELIFQVREAVTLPVTALGGAGSLEHVRQLIDSFGIVGAAVGSLFVFKGRYRAVLINYPRRPEKDALVAGRHRADP